MNSHPPRKQRKPRTDNDYAFPVGLADPLSDSKRYQAQVAWTVLVALGVAAAAFSQVILRSVQPRMVSTAVETEQQQRVMVIDAMDLGRREPAQQVTGERPAEQVVVSTGHGARDARILWKQNQSSE